MTEKNETTDFLEDLFAEVRVERDAEPVSAELLSRVLDTALEMQPGPTRLDMAPSENAGVLKQMLGALGGWPSLSGLAVATLASVWIGFAALPDLLNTGVAGVLGADAEIYLAYLEDFSDFGLEE